MRRRSSGPYPRRSARVVTAPTLPPVPRHRSPGGRCDRHVRAAAHRPEAAALCSGLVLGCVEPCLAGGVGAVLVGLGEALRHEREVNEELVVGSETVGQKAPVAITSPTGAPPAHPCARGKTPPPV